MAYALFRGGIAGLANTVVLSWVSVGWLVSFWCMGAAAPGLNVIGVVLCAHTMILAAYLVHEAAHQTLFMRRGANFAVGEAMSFIAGASYASFERIRHMHIRHHMERCDLTCFDLKGLLERRPLLRRGLQALEWAYVPATEVLMHLQVIWRPFFVTSERAHRSRCLGVLCLRLTLLGLLGWWSLKALISYGLAYGLMLHVLNFFDAFHHTFEQHCVTAEGRVPLEGRDRHYEQANTYSNLISLRHPWVNLLTLNFGYHNAHHEKASVPWYGLPALHARAFGATAPAVLPVAELLRTWHRNRVRRVHAEDYGGVGQGAGRAEHFVGAHGVSFLTVV